MLKIEARRLETTGTAARLLDDKSVSLVRHYVRQGRLPAIRDASGRFLFRTEDVLTLRDELIHRREQKQRGR